MNWYRNPRLRPALAGAALLLLPAPPAAQAQLKVDITEGGQDPLPIAIPDFTGAAAAEAELGGKIAGVIAADLERSGLFAPLDQAALPRDAASLAVRPNFNNWRVLNAQALLAGNVAIQTDDGRLRADFRLWDVSAEQAMAGLSLTTTRDNWRRLSHIIADAVYKRVTGEEGYFDTRIVYVDETGTLTDRVKKLAIMDQDGANFSLLTDGSASALTPRFSPTAQQITYLEVHDNRSRIYLLDVDTGHQEVLGEYPGHQQFPARFSPDGRKVLMSLAHRGNTDIYERDLVTGADSRLTTSPAIDTAASYSPDGRRIVFESDRGGSQQIYVMNADGSGVTRLSTREGKYATPVWSPRGDLIAFTRLERERWYIGVMSPDGEEINPAGSTAADRHMRLLAEGRQIEGPTWAPNGRVLMYFGYETEADARAGNTRLFTVDLTGRHRRVLKTEHFASDPAWSPITP